MLVFIILFVVAAVVIIMRNRDIYHIGKNLKTLSTLVTKSKSSNLTGVTLLARAAALRKLFSEDCTVSLGESIPEVHGMDEFIPKTLGIEEVMAVYARTMQSVSDITVTFHDVSITIAENRKNAESLMTAKVKCAECYEGEEGIDAREFSFGWERVEGKWKIKKVKEVKTLY